jgi:hypothetical protein
VPGSAPRGPQAQHPIISQACKFALCMCVPHLECAELAAAFYKYLQEGRSVHFGEFLNSTCKHLVSSVCVGAPPRAGLRTLTLVFYRCTTSLTCWAA